MALLLVFKTMVALLLLLPPKMKLAGPPAVTASQDADGPPAAAKDEVDPPAAAQDEAGLLVAAHQWEK